MPTARKPAPGPLPAYALHRWDWSESSLIVDLFTRERGRLVVVARGAKRPHSQLRPLLMPFQRLMVQLGRAPADEAAEVHLLRGAEWSGGTTIPTGRALFAGFYVNELVLKLLARGDAHAALFDAYADTLTSVAVAEGDPGIQPALRAFELRLLRELGLLPDLATETLTLQPLRAGRHYTLHPEAGLVAAAADTVAGSAWLQAEAALAHGSQAALRAAVGTAGVPLRGVLRRLLQYHLGTPSLKTRQVLAGVQKLTGA